MGFIISVKEFECIMMKSVACTVQLRMRGWFVSPLKSEKR